MFNPKRLNGLAKFFGISDKEMVRAAARMAGHLRRIDGEIDEFAVLSALIFLRSTIEEARKERERGGLAYHLRSPSHQKWEMEIIRLYHQGYGAKRISDAIAQKKGPRIGKTTIERFISKNCIRRAENG